MTQSAGQARASSGAQFEREVRDIIRELGLRQIGQVAMGVSILGRRRITDFVVYDESGRYLGIECKFQSTSGSAEDKLVHTITDFDARPIRHILVFGGDGFSQNIRGYLLASGKAVEVDQLRNYLVFYFGLEENFRQYARRRD